MLSAMLSAWKESWPLFVISTKAEGRAEKSGREWALRHIRSQMSRLRCASLDMTDGAGFPRNPGEGPRKPRVLNRHFFVVHPSIAFY
jgi:hypothetical protein